MPDEMKPLIGTYYANFGPFKHTPFQVVFRCGKLALDIPGDLVYELREPDKEGLWRFASTTRPECHSRETVKAKCWLVMHKSGKPFELPRDKRVDAERPKK